MNIKKEKGDLAVSFSIPRLTELGWNVAIPLTEHEKYDLLAEKDGKCIRVQVKYTTPVENTLRVQLSNSWQDRNGNHITTRKASDFDLLAIFNPFTKKMYFINGSEFTNKSTITLRLKKSKNGQKLRTRKASDYTEVNYLS
jgi:hypothetical protein